LQRRSVAAESGGLDGDSARKDQTSDIDRTTEDDAHRSQRDTPAASAYTMQHSHDLLTFRRIE